RPHDAGMRHAARRAVRLPPRKRVSGPAGSSLRRAPSSVRRVLAGRVPTRRCRRVSSCWYLLQLGPCAGPYATAPVLDHGHEFVGELEAEVLTKQSSLGIRGWPLESSGPVHRAVGRLRGILSGLQICWEPMKYEDSARIGAFGRTVELRADTGNHDASPRASR